MKKFALLGFAIAMLGASAPPADGVVSLSTDRKVHGVITAIEHDREQQTITIASSQRRVTGRIDAARTKVTVNGKPGSVADLQLTNHAKAELCLDDVWVAIDMH